MTNKRKNIIFIAAVLAAAAVLWLVCRTGGSGHTAVLRYGTPQTEQRIDLRRDADYDIDTGRYIDEGATRPDGAMESGKFKMICLSDDSTELDFDQERQFLKELFEARFPAPSSFEKGQW